MRWSVAYLLLLASLGVVASGQTLEELTRQVRAVALDPAECYRVRELNFVKEDLRVYLTEGHLIFAPAINGIRFAAVFTIEQADAGDAEILLMPPTASERRSLARYAKAPNLNERFRSALILAVDGSLDQLYREIHAQENVRRQPEVGAVIGPKWDSVIRNLGQSFEIRILQDLLTPRNHEYGFFYLAVQSRNIGTFDIFYDPRAPEQFLVGRMEQQENNNYFDTWTSFKARSVRQGQRAMLPVEVTLKQYEIEATLTPDLRLSCKTKVTFSPAEGSEGVLPLDISGRMRVTGVSIDGQPAQFLQHESLRASLLRGDGNETFLVVPPTPLASGGTYTLEIQHDGGVVADAGNNVYLVGSRGFWYPNRGLQFSRFDLLFRTPKNLSLVAAGDLVETAEEAEYRVSRFRTPSPIRLMGFNLGDYDRSQVTEGKFTIEVCANRRAERALEARSQQFVLVPQNPPWIRGQRRPAEYIALPVPPSRNIVRLRELADDVSAAYSWMAESFGAPPWNRLIISPIPGSFGQGFPGLVYISTLSYLSELDAPLASRRPLERLFFLQHLPVHETAHQWWGNTLVPETHQDDWLMEALADYTALMFLEKRRGASTLAEILNSYRERLLEKTAGGETIESFGPIVWGGRLLTSQSPQSWQAITYQKGAWIIHMLRGILGDAQFRAFLAALRKTYEFKTVSTEQFRALAVKFLPADYPERNLESFFQQYVYDSGIPALRMEYKLTGRAPALNLTARVIQSDVREDFSVLVPVEVQLPAGPPIRRWLRTGDEDAVLELTLKAAPGKVTLDPRSSVLFIRK